jgi:hypothetical protein
MNILEQINRYYMVATANAWREKSSVIAEAGAQRTFALWMRKAGKISESEHKEIDTLLRDWEKEAAACGR